jgi:hypothetical protein
VFPKLEGAEQCLQPRELESELLAGGSSSLPPSRESRHPYPTVLPPVRLPYTLFRRLCQHPIPVALNIPSTLTERPPPLGAQDLTSTTLALSSPRPQPALPRNYPGTKLVRHAAAPAQYLRPTQHLSFVYTPIDLATAPHHRTRPRLETTGTRGLVPTTARAGFVAHLQ